jgi:hypothetical protein
MRRLAVTMWCFISLVLLVPSQAALASVIAQGRLEWAAASGLSFDDGGDVYPYTITGPGVLIITYTVSPYVERINYSSKDKLLQFDSSGWGKILKSESWYDGRPASSLQPSQIQPDGSIRSRESSNSLNLKSAA